jgi:predicted RNA-binding protein with PIN domain
VVLVDAENARRSLWPNIGPAELVERTAIWARRAGVRAVVVFDGDAPSDGSEELDAIGTGAESADDWIAREARRLRGAGETFWLVTSDRALREQAGAGAARVIGGGTFARGLPQADH